MISIVIPAFNERETIGATIDEFASVLDENKIAPFEIVVVDDGSDDGTGDVARKHGAKVIRHPHKAGYGRSLKDGILAARFDVVMITDADATYPAEALPDLVARFNEGFDMVVGARTGAHYRQSLIKMPLRYLLKLLVEYTAGRSIPDINSGLRVFHRTAAISYFAHLCDTFSFTTSITLSYMMTGRYVAYIPIGYNKRVGRSKVRLFSDSLKTFQYILEAAIYYNPLKIFLLASLLVLGGGGFLFAAALLFQLSVFFFLGVGASIASLVILSLGLQTVLLRQIMRSSDGARLDSVDTRKCGTSAKPELIQVVGTTRKKGKKIKSASENQR